MDSRRFKRVISIVISLTFAITMFGLVTVCASAAAKPTKLTLTTTSKTVDVKGQVTVSVKSVKPAKADKKVVWKTSNKKIATVSAKGVVKGKKKGTVKITAVSKSNKTVKATIKIKVKDIKPTALTLDQTSLVLKTGGDPATLKATVEPAYVYNKGVTFESADPGIAAVDAKGNVTPAKAGTTTITAKTKEGGLTAACQVAVLANASMAEDVFQMSQYVDEAEDYAFDVAYKLAYDDELADDKTGFRTAGSDAEHAASKYLKKEFQNIGLTDVSRVPVTVDKWQFNEAYLSLNYKRDGIKKNLRIDEMVSYASPGTVQLPGKADWNNMEIVDAGMGFAEDYDALAADGIDVTGKLVLVGVDQWNEVWIDGPYMQAYERGAAGLITYQVGGYGQKNDDTMNIQDLCCEMLDLPTTSISPNSAAKIQVAIENADAGTLKAKFFVDNEVGDENGTSYNVVGKIKGKTPNAQQIVIAGHYDKYFYGFQDDCIAVGLVMGIAKAMVDAGYQPENDIVFVAHAAEEWGEFGTSTDWGIGSWEMITEAKADWQGRTLALLNYELPAIDHGAPQGIMRSTYEMGTLCQEFLDSGVMDVVEPFYPNGIVVVNDDEMTQTDVICYQYNGVPSVMPRQDDRTIWTQEHYHTQFDNVDTYSEGLLTYDLACYAALAMYIDQRPALELDFTQRCDELDEAITDSTANYTTAEKISQYKDAAAALRTASESYLEKARDINTRYEAAVATGASADEIQAIRDEGAVLNQKTLKIFRYSQDTFIGLNDYSDTDVFHVGNQINLEMLDDTIEALSDGEVTDDDIWIPAEMYGYMEYYAYIFDREVCERSNKVLMNESMKDGDNWSVGKMSFAAPTYDITQKMCELFYDQEKTATADYTEVIQGYTNYKTVLQGMLNDYMDQEIDGMQKMALMLK